MSEAEAIAFALGESPHPAPRPDGTRDGPGAASSPAGSRTWRHWSPGLSNSQIAAELVISAGTVETRVQHIMDKLGCSTRAQIAA